MSGTYGPTPEQQWLLEHGARLVGNTYPHRNRIKALGDDHWFFYSKNRYSNGTNSWYVHLDDVEQLCKEAGLSYELQEGRAKVVNTKGAIPRYDCTDERDPSVRYNINRDSDWDAIHKLQPGTNVKDSANSNDHLMCPENECGHIKLRTRMGSGPRMLIRKQGEKDCTKCGKVRTPSEPHSPEHPSEDLKHIFDPDVIPRNAGALRADPPDPSQDYFRSTAGYPGTGASTPDPEPTPEPEPVPVSEEPAEPPAPVPDYFGQIPDMQPAAEDKTNGRRELNWKKPMVGALALLVVLVLVLWVFLQ